MAESDDKNTETAVPSWRAWFPDLEIPDGFTFDDLKEIAALIRAWGDDEESTAIPLAAKLILLLRAAAARNKEKDLSAAGAD